jgi:hypothetical protein
VSIFKIRAAAATDYAFFRTRRRKKNCASLIGPVTGRTTTEPFWMGFSDANTLDMDRDRRRKRSALFIDLKSHSRMGLPQGILNLWDSSPKKPFRA